MAKSSRKKELPAPTAPMWMITYGDMMSLLLCFFVMLLSFANLDIVKFKEAAGSLKNALGIMKEDPENEKIKLIPPRNPKLSQQSQHREARMQTIRHIFSRRNVGNMVDAQNQQTGIRFKIEGSVLFEPGSATLRESAYPILGAVAEALNEFDDDIRIDGHTDLIPFPQQSERDNMWLSVERSYNVRKAFAEQFDVGAARMSVQGFGPNKPVDRGTDAQALSRNRRVEIWLMARELRETRSEFQRRTDEISRDWLLPPIEQWRTGAR